MKTRPCDTHTDQEPSPVGWALWKHRLCAASQVRLGIQSTQCFRAHSYQCASTRDRSHRCVVCEHAASTATIVICCCGAYRLTCSASDAYSLCSTAARSTASAAAASPPTSSPPLHCRSASSPPLRCRSSSRNPSPHVSTRSSQQLYVWYRPTTTCADGI